jgi:hypothetical protein
LLVASTLAGSLWQAIGPAATFLTGAGLTFVAWIALQLHRHDVPQIDGRR